MNLFQTMVLEHMSMFVVKNCQRTVQFDSANGVWSKSRPIIAEKCRGGWGIELIMVTIFETELGDNQHYGSYDFATCFAGETCAVFMIP